MQTISKKIDQSALAVARGLTTLSSYRIGKKIEDIAPVEVQYRSIPRKGKEPVHVPHSLLIMINGVSQTIPVAHGIVVGEDAPAPVKISALHYAELTRDTSGYKIGDKTVVAI